MPRFLLITGFLLVMAAPAAADSDWDTNPFLNSKFRFTPGLFLTDYNSSFAVTGSGGEEVEVDFDEVWKTGTSDSRFAGELLWRFGEKWSVAFQYLDSDNSNTVTLQEDIEWEDYTLNAGSTASAGLETNITRVFFGRKFSYGDDHQFGAGIGFHWLDVSIFAEGEFFLNGESTGVRREEVSASAPLPNIGAWYEKAINKRWAWYTRVDWLSASIDEYSGSIVNAAAGVNFQATQHIGLGAAYNFFRINVDVDKNDWHGGVELEQQGPFLYVDFVW